MRSAVGFLLNLFRRFYLKFSKGLKSSSGVKFSVSTTFEGGNSIGKKTILNNCHLGYGSYVADHSALSHTHVGRFCSIGSHVQCVLGRHPSKDYVSTHPAFFSVLKQSGFSYVKQNSFQETADPPNPSLKNHRIVIENDVWIGSRSSIMEGVKIGNGAIVAANALVVKDVEPYTIVGGVPAKVIGHRFDKETINWLLELQWWNKNQSWLKKNASFFTSAEKLKDHLSKSEK